MNLLEHYIEKVISVVDVTKEWEKCMQEEDPNFVETDPYMKIKLLVDCMGIEQHKIIRCHKSQWEKIKEQGYYMA